MSEYGVTDKGFMPKRLDVIMAEVHQDLTEGFGVDTSINPQSFLNVLVTGFSDKIAELWEVGQEVYASEYPSSASSLSLDNAVEYGGIKRATDQKTYYSVLCSGDDGTFVQEGAIIQSTTKPPIVFAASQGKAISRSNFNRVSIKVLSVQAQTAYTVGINGNIYSFSSGPNPTAEYILSGLKSAILAPNYTVEVNGELLTIKDDSLQKSNALILSENLTTESVSTLISFGSGEYGKFLLPDGSITNIVTNADGFKSCVNLVAPIFGRFRETDVELRHSYIKRIAVRSNCMLESITSAILDKVQGVVSVTAYENDTNAEDAEGRPPHSVEVIVDGGSETAIAQQMLEKKAGGIQTFGTVAVDVPDLYGKTITIRFNRPQYVYAWLKIVLTVNPAQAMPPNYADLTKLAIIEQTGSIEAGTSVFTQTFLHDIYKRVSGVAFVDIAAFATTDPGQTPASYDEENIIVSARQRAIIEETRIEVTLKNVP